MLEAESSLGRACNGLLVCTRPHSFHLFGPARTCGLGYADTGHKAALCLWWFPLLESENRQNDARLPQWRHQAVASFCNGAATVFGCLASSTVLVLVGRRVFCPPTRASKATHTIGL